MSARAKKGRTNLRQLGFGKAPGAQCLGKDRYHSQRAADAAIAKLPGFSRAYRCRICTYLHLTSKEKHSK